MAQCFPGWLEHGALSQGGFGLRVQRSGQAGHRTEIQVIKKILPKGKVCTAGAHLGLRRRESVV